MTIQVKKSGNLVQITEVETGNTNYPTSIETSIQTKGETIWLYTSNRNYVAHYTEIYDGSGQSKSSLQETLDYLSEFIG